MSRRKSVKTLFRESESKTSHFDPYTINDSEDTILMNVIPGDTGQSSVSDAFLENEKIIKAAEGIVEDFPLGTNRELRGKFLEVYTAVTDIPGDPDETSFRFQLTGGVKPYEYFTKKTVQAQGDSVVYKITIFFTIH